MISTYTKCNSFDVHISMYVGLCVLERAPDLGNKVFVLLYCIVL